MYTPTLIKEKFFRKNASMHFAFFDLRLVTHLLKCTTTSHLHQQQYRDRISFPLLLSNGWDSSLSRKQTVWAL
ncbi:hypothetical protein [Legionella sp. WA2022007384]